MLVPTRMGRQEGKSTQNEKEEKGGMEMGMAYQLYGGMKIASKMG